jgi:hypothetical protein
MGWKSGTSASRAKRWSARLKGEFRRLNFK